MFVRVEQSDKGPPTNWTGPENNTNTRILSSNFKTLQDVTRKCSCLQDPQKFSEISPSTLANSESSCPKRRSAAVVGVATTNMHSRMRITQEETGDAQTTHDGIALHFRCLVRVGSLSNRIPNFLIVSSAKEAHIPRRLHPNTKQRRRVTGPPKPSFCQEL